MWKPKPDGVPDRGMRVSEVAMAGIADWRQGRETSFRSSSLTTRIYHKRYPVMPRFLSGMLGNADVEEQLQQGYVWFDVVDFWSYAQIIGSGVRVHVLGNTLEFCSLERPKDDVLHYIKQARSFTDGKHQSMDIERKLGINRQLWSRTTCNHLQSVEDAFLDTGCHVYVGPVADSSDKFHVQLPGLHADLPDTVDYAIRELQRGLEAGAFGKSSGAVFDMVSEALHTQQALEVLFNEYKEMTE